MKNKPNRITIKIYKRRLAIKVRTFRQAKQTSWRQYISSLTAKTPTSKLWKRIRKVSGKYIPKPHPILKQGNNTITSKEEVAEIFAENYAATSTARRQHEIPQRVPWDNSQTQTINHDFTMRELEDSIRFLEEGKASGEDQIDNAMLRRLPPVSRRYLLDLTNRMWREGSFPQEWKSSTIIPIHKAGKEPTDPKNYRPISLTSNVCKLIEKMINTRLKWFLEKNQKLSSQQYGFRQERNTTDPIAALTTDILNGFKNQKTTTAVFFDFEKAFDTISRRTIIDSLSKMGVNGRMLKFFHNYLSERTIKVKIGNTSSRNHTTTAGVLSATCFIAAINSILDSLPTGTKGSLYADDLVIYNTSSRLQSSARTLQNFIGKLESEAQSMGLRLSPPKSEVIHFYRNIKGGKTRDFPPLDSMAKKSPRKKQPSSWE